MSKVFVAILLSFFSLNASAMLTVKAGARVFEHSTLSTRIMNQSIIVDNNDGTIPLVIPPAAILYSGFKSASQMLDLLKKTYDFREIMFVLECRSSLETAQIEACFYPREVSPEERN